jgi:hypothetical protein
MIPCLDMVSSLPEPKSAVSRSSDPPDGMATVQEKVKHLREQAKELIKSLPPVLHSEDVSSFRDYVLPVILSFPHDDDSAMSMWQQARNPPPNHENIGVRGLTGLTTWIDARQTVESALQKCFLNRCASVDANYSNSHAGGEAVWWQDPADEGVLQLCCCRKCGRVVTQSRFCDHWKACDTFTYTQQQLVSTATLKPSLPIPPKPKLPKKEGGMSTSSKDKKKRKLPEDAYYDLNAPMDAYDEIEIEVVTCDGCGISPIEGVYIQCTYMHACVRVLA